MEIKNRSQKKIKVEVNESKNSKGLIFLEHGVGYNRKELSIKTVSKTFKENDYTTITFDATNSLGESDGLPENATTTNYLNDLEDVIFWAKNQKWYKEPFFLAGHSIGGSCAILFGQKNPKIVKGIISIAPVVSQELGLQAYPKEVVNRWKKDGILEWEENGKKRRMKWNFVEDGLKYDLFKNIENLKMPVWIIIGEFDLVSPLEHQRILYPKLKTQKKLAVIRQAPHLMTEKIHLEKLEKITKEFLENF